MSESPLEKLSDSVNKLARAVEGKNQAGADTTTERYPQYLAPDQRAICRITGKREVTTCQGDGCTSRCSVDGAVLHRGFRCGTCGACWPHHFPDKNGWYTHVTNKEAQDE